MISRWQEKNLVSAINARRAVHLTGVRQCGKSTLARGPFTGIVLYSGERTLPFGEGLYAVPLGALAV